MPDSISQREAPWWLDDLDSEERVRRVEQRMDRIRRVDLLRKKREISRLREYGHAILDLGLSFGIGAGLGTLTNASNAWNRKRAGYNVIKAVADTFVSNVTKDDPKVSVVTDGGDWSLQEKAKNLEAFLSGQFYEMNLYQQGKAACLDGGGITGTGVIKFYIDGEGEDARIKAERVQSFELLVDLQEGARGAPRNLGQECWVDREVLASSFPEKAEDIRQAEPKYDAQIVLRGTIGYDSTADQLLVTEVWHLKSGPGKDDGRRILKVADIELVYEPWEHEWFPFAWYRKQEAPVGFWGVSLADELEGLQGQINTRLMRLENGLRMVGCAHVLVHSTSKVNFSQWDNEAGSKIEYQGIKPEVYVPAEVVPAQLIEAIERDYHRAFELTGVPEAQAMGATPTNLDSGKAQEVYLDVTDKRMQVWIHRYHDLFLQAAQIVIALGREIVDKHNPKFAAKAAMGVGMRRVLLSEAKLREEEYLLRPWPTRALADEPAARMAQIERMASAGWLSPDQARRLLDFPDLKGDADLQFASQDLTRRMVTLMLDEGRYMPPNPYMNLEESVHLVQQALLHAWVEKRPEHRLQLLRDWIADAAVLAQKAGLNVQLQPPSPAGPQQQPAPQQAPAAPAAIGGANGVMQ